MKISEVFDLGRDQFKVFVEEVIGLNNTGFHNDLDDALSDPLNKKICISFPRGHGKSTHISVAYPLWRIAKDHNLRILIISSTAMISRSFMTEMLGHIEKNDMYKLFTQYVDKDRVGVIPKMKNYSKTKENWAGDSIVIDRTNLNLKDPTINAVGLFGSILSKRADLIICDDVVNQENSNTEEQRLKVIDWIYTTVIPVLIPGGTFIYLGNTWHQDDLVSRLLKDPQFDYRKRIPSILKEPDHPDLWQNWASIIMDESKTVEDRRIEAETYYQTNKETMMTGIKTLWPERYSYKDLYLMRLANPYSFSRMYQCDPSNRPDQRFRDEWLEAASLKGKDLILQDEIRKDLVMDVTASGLDLAISLEAGSDDTALLTLDRVKFGNEIIKTGDYVIRNIKRGKMTPNEVRMMVKDEYEKVRPNGIRVESVAYQEAMVRDLGQMGIPVRGYHTGGEKFDPEIGVNSLAIIAELGKLVIPYGMDHRTRQLCSQLMNEMRAFPDGHTGDSLMSLWFAFSEIRDLTGDKFSVPTIAGQFLTRKTDLDIKDVGVRRSEEKKADLALAMESEYERSEFKRMMGFFGR